VTNRIRAVRRRFASSVLKPEILLQTHSWHWELFASTAPTVAADENSDFGMRPLASLQGTVMMASVLMFSLFCHLPLRFLRHSGPFVSSCATASNFSIRIPLQPSAMAGSAEALSVFDIRSRLVWGLASVTGVRFVSPTAAIRHMLAR